MTMFYCCWKEAPTREIRANNGWTMGNQLERFLKRAKAGSDEYQKLTEIKEKLIEHGGKWPPTPVK